MLGPETAVMVVLSRSDAQAGARGTGGDVENGGKRKTAGCRQGYLSLLAVAGKGWEGLGRAGNASLG